MAVDLVTEARKIQALKNEVDSLSARRALVQQELDERLAAMNKVIMPDYQPKPAAYGRKKSPLKPRPVEDKLAIAAGKSIVAGLAAKWTPQQTLAEAIKAATKLAKKYKIDKLPPSVLERIEKKVRIRFNVASV
jgi:fructose-1-phosphate kinase PfkB-like protein